MNQEEFTRLAEKYCQGACNQQEKALFEKVYQEFQQHEGIPAMIPQKEDKGQRIFSQIEKEIAYEAKSKKHSRNNMLKIAAAITLLISGTWLWLFLNQDTNSPATLKVVTTEYGQKSTVELSDGSVVVLNSGSQLQYPEQFGQDKRMVKLQGEAFFEVTKNTAAPFSIESNGITTTVLGTSFNINTFNPQQLMVTVMTGSVQVQENNSLEMVELSRNQQAMINPESSQIKVNQVMAAHYCDWKDHVLRFDAEKLVNVAQKLERWYGYQFSFANQQIKDCPITGEFKEESLLHVLKAIETITKVQFKLDGEQIQFYGNACN